MRAALFAGSLLVLAVAGCGLVNALGGPFPPFGGSDGGTIISDGGTCPDGQRNGGDGVCVDEGDCSTGFFPLGAGCAGFVEVGNLSPARALAAAARLSDGRVLVVGGKNGSAPVAGAAIYDDGERDFVTIGADIRARFGHTLSPLAGNRLVVVGGVGDQDMMEPLAELYRVDQDAWAELAPLNQARRNHVALDAAEGTFWVIGGTNEVGSPLSSIEELASGEWQTLSLSLDLARAGAGAVASAGRVFVIGGKSATAAPLRSAEGFDVVSMSRIQVESMFDARAAHTVTLLPDGRIWVTGGLTEVAGQDAVLATTEFYDPETNAWTNGPRMLFPRYGHAVVAAGPNQYLVIGGFDDQDAPISSVEVFNPNDDTLAEGPPLQRPRGHVVALPVGESAALVIQGSADKDDLAPVASVERYTYVE